MGNPFDFTQPGERPPQKTSAEWYHEQQRRVAERDGANWCPHCNSRVLGVADKPNHVLHAILSLFLVGLWLFVWAMICSFDREVRCSRCGTRCGIERGSTLAAVLLLAAGVVVVLGVLLVLRGRIG